VSGKTTSVGVELGEESTESAGAPPIGVSVKKGVRIPPVAVVSPLLSRELATTLAIPAQ
jgi:hypothetical protein